MGLLDISGQVLSGVTSTVGKAVTGLLSDSANRLNLAGLSNGAMSTKKTTVVTTWSSQASASSSTGVLDDDWRVRLSIASGAPILYSAPGNEFLTPLYNTSGVIFPITPQIQVTHTAKYSPQSLTHSNYGMHFYDGSEVSSININAEFPIQNIEEGQYLLAAIYFFRAATKMFWGDTYYGGSPPPMLYLNGYGASYFPNVSCVVTSFSHTMPENVDYIDIPHPGATTSGKNNSTRLPIVSTLQVTVQPILSRVKAHAFDLEQFANGGLLGNKTGGYL